MNTRQISTLENHTNPLKRVKQHQKQSKIYTEKERKIHYCQLLSWHTYSSKPL